MKNPMVWLIAVAVVGLGIAGISFLANASSGSTLIAEQSRTPSLVAGISCLVLATGVLVLGAVMFRKRD